MRLKRREDYCLLYPPQSPWLRLLSNPWNLTRLGPHDRTGEGLRQSGWVPLISPFLNLTVWFALAGTIDPSAPKGWWLDAVATRTLEKSPSLQVCWFWVPQLKSLSRVQPPRHLSRKQCPRLGWVWKEGWSLKGKKQWDTRTWVFLRHIPLLFTAQEADFPEVSVCLKNQSWTWNSAATWWTFPVTTIETPCLLAPPVDKACGLANNSCLHERSWGGYCRHKLQRQRTFKKPTASGNFSTHTLRRKTEKKQSTKDHRTRFSASLIIQEDSQSKQQQEI